MNVCLFPLPDASWASRVYDHAAGTAGVQVVWYSTTFLLLLFWDWLQCLLKSWTWCDTSFMFESICTWYLVFSQVWKHVTGRRMSCPAELIAQHTNTHTQWEVTDVIALQGYSLLLCVLEGKPTLCIMPNSRDWPFVMWPRVLPHIKHNMILMYCWGVLHPTVKILHKDKNLHYIWRWAH